MLLMDWLVAHALLPASWDRPGFRSGLSTWMLYVRSHWLRMPPLLLAARPGYRFCLLAQFALKAAASY
jgi:hypothetical protein